MTQSSQSETASWNALWRAMTPLERALLCESAPPDGSCDLYPPGWRPPCSIHAPAHCLIGDDPARPAA